ncbi:hypothetical protein B0T14DRAFT_231752 [Immersiella caudata]|uniref:Uncharacterized protein n=1 Tax=Immersiella caudata TaxID=314043 RepID=A0AA39WRU2_9PEZI|nr:hypothetical protein B0T14DRAFT_231752 [Immersiella caudata]
MFEVHRAVVTSFRCCLGKRFGERASELAEIGHGALPVWCADRALITPNTRPRGVIVHFANQRYLPTLVQVPKNQGQRAAPKCRESKPAVEGQRRRAIADRAASLQAPMPACRPITPIQTTGSQQQKLSQHALRGRETPPGKVRRPSGFSNEKSHPIGRGSGRQRSAEHRFESAEITLAPPSNSTSSGGVTAAVKASRCMMAPLQNTAPHTAKPPKAVTTSTHQPHPEYSKIVSGVVFKTHSET